MRIHQLLHGYSEGHKLLAGSLSNIPPKDRKKLAVLSDWDEYATGRDDDSYITCYPLPESNYYAIAKTWYANDMDRPGCVWTHTLLIDCSDDSVFLDLRQLYYYFCRPVVGNYSEYEMPIELNQDDRTEKNNPILLFDEPSLDYWLYELLYGKTPLTFTVEKTSDYYQQLVLSFISHLSKPLMYRFSICSGTGRVRKYENKLFDLQFITVYKNNIPRLSWPVVDNDVDGWCKFIASSIKTGGDSLPRLAYRFSSDIGDRVDRYAAVIIVYELLDRLKEPGEQNVSKFNFALRVMAEVFPTEEEGKYFKSVILSQGLTKYFFDEREFIFQMAVTPYWRSFDYNSFKYQERVRAYVSSMEVDDFAPLMSSILSSQCDNPVKTETLMQTVMEYSEEDCQLLLTDYWDYFLFLAQHDYRMLSCKAWIASDREKFLKLIQLFQQKTPPDFKYWDVLLTKLLWEDVQVDQEVISTIGQHIDTLVGDVLNRMSFGYHVGSLWGDYCKSEPTKVMAWMKERFSLNNALVRLVLDTFDPRSELVRGSDTFVWACMLNAEIDSGMLLEYSTFLFVLSYNLHRDNYAFLYYQKSFLPIYEAAAEDRIDYYWMEIGPYCPKPLFGWEWDRCDMLRKGFAERVFNEDRGVKTAKKFTTKNSLNKKLYKQVIKKYQK